MQLDSNRLGLLITGGEPTFEQHYDDTIRLLYKLRYTVANVETNGHQLERMLGEVDWSQSPVKFMYSPKILDSDSVYTAIQLTTKILDHPNVYIKIPYLDNGYTDQYCEWLSKEIAEREMVHISMVNQFNHKVWLMPVGSDLMEQEEASAGVMDACETYRFNFSGRLHIMYNFL
jgi:organic radical activating enzyme